MWNFPKRAEKISHFLNKKTPDEMSEKYIVTMESAYWNN